MGIRQSKIHKNKSTATQLPSPINPSADHARKLTAANLQQEPSPKSETRTQTKSTNVAHINSFEAKNWNPTNAASLNEVTRQYHNVPNSEYMGPNDIDEQNRLEMQHYIMRAAFDG
ncbi:hypothetical protein HK100_010570, partial [Physocladia obscura]